MKKLITLSALTFTLCFLFSCTKDSQSLNTTSGINQNSSGNQDGPRMSPTPAPHPDIVGDWVSLKLQQVTNGAYNGLHGSYILNNPLTSDYNTDVKLVFIRIAPFTSLNPSSDYAYRVMPTDMVVTTGKVHLAFYLGSTTLDVGIISYDPSKMPNADEFTSLEYRYFVVTRDTYLNNPIDWTDYNAVVTVLNTAP